MLRQIKHHGLSHKIGHSIGANEVLLRRAAIVFRAHRLAARWTDWRHLIGLRYYRHRQSPIQRTRNRNAKLGCRSVGYQTYAPSIAVEPVSSLRRHLKLERERSIIVPHSWEANMKEDTLDNIAHR